jgi:hypothetical protein
MSGPEFFQTQMGARFFQATMPSIARNLEKLAKHFTEKDKPSFSDRETATVLAALRYFQANHSDAVEACDLHFASHAPLTDKEIDSLCEHINLGNDTP